MQANDYTDAAKRVRGHIRRTPPYSSRPGGADLAAGYGQH